MFIAVIDNAAHSGFVTEFDPADLWPDGSLTYQELCGSHGSVLCEGTEADCKRELDKWLDCPAARAGHYCFTHNPKGM